MARACKAAAIVHRHPHDLRHRYASVQIGRGVPVTLVAAQLGHTRKSLPLDTYSHVLTAAIDDPTAIKVTDGTVEVVSEGHWKLFDPSPEASGSGP